MTKRYQNEDWLREKYVQEGLTAVEIADICDVVYQTITRWLKKFDVEIRGNWHDKDDRYRDEGWLRNEYIEDGLTTIEIADECDVSVSTINDWLCRFGIERRGRSAENEDFKYRDEEWLREKYWEDGLSISDIAEECDALESTIWKWMRRFNIERREGNSAHIDEDAKHRDEEWLRKKYCDEYMSVPRIAEVCEVDADTIYKWMKRFGIERRDGGGVPMTGNKKKYHDKEWLNCKYYGEDTSISEIAEVCEVDVGTIRRWMDIFDIERRDSGGVPAVNNKKYRDKEWLNQKYWVEGMKMDDIADLCEGSVSDSTIRRWLNNFDLGTRDRGHPDVLEQRIREGEDCHNWKGGVSRDASEYLEKRRSAKGDWRTNRLRALERDEYTCQAEGCDEDTNLVHHVTPIMDGGTNELGNLMTCCRSCHAKIEFS